MTRPTTRRSWQAAAGAGRPRESVRGDARRARRVARVFVPQRGVGRGGELASHMRYEATSEAQLLGYAQLLLEATPMAAPPRLDDKGGAPTALHPSSSFEAAAVNRTCELLSREALQWVRSRSDTSAIRLCLQVQQARALSRAAGLRLAARLLRMYAAQPHGVSHLLELMQKARGCHRPAVAKGGAGGAAGTATNEPSQPHYLVQLGCCGVLASAHLRAAFAESLEGLTALLEPPTTAEEGSAASSSPPPSPGRLRGGVHAALSPPSASVAAAATAAKSPPLPGGGCAPGGLATDRGRGGRGASTWAPAWRVKCVDAGCSRFRPCTCRCCPRIVS